MADDNRELAAEMRRLLRDYGASDIDDFIRMYRRWQARNDEQRADIAALDAEITVRCEDLIDELQGLADDE